MEMESGIKELVVAVGGKMKDESMKMNRGDYVRRYNFADEAVLVEHLHRYGCGVELSAEDFAAGRWESALAAAAAAASTPKTTAPPPTGAVEAAEILAKYL